MRVKFTARFVGRVPVLGVIAAKEGEEMDLPEAAVDHMLARAALGHKEFAVLDTTVGPSRKAQVAAQKKGGGKLKAAGRDK